MYIDLNAKNEHTIIYLIILKHYNTKVVLYIWTQVALHVTINQSSKDQAIFLYGCTCTDSIIISIAT